MIKKQIFRLLLIFSLISIFDKYQNAEVYLDAEDGVAFSEVPFIMFSSTFTFRNGKKKFIKSEILSVLQDGTAYLSVTMDNQRNLTLPARDRKIIIKSYGPSVLPEELRARLQTFFSDSLNWSLASNSYIDFQDKSKNGIWLADLTLQYGMKESKCYISSVNKAYEPLSKPGYDFIFLLKTISKFVVQENC